MNKEQLQEGAIIHFKKGVTVIYATEDGQYFAQLGYANMHGNNRNLKVYTLVPREDSLPKPPDARVVNDTHKKNNKKNNRK